MSIFDQFRFSFVFFRGFQISALIAIQPRLLLVASLLMLGYDATASSKRGPSEEPMTSFWQVRCLRFWLWWCDVFSLILFPVNFVWWVILLIV